MSGFKKILMAMIWIFPPTIGHAQSDSITLHHKEYLENVLLFHPIAEKASLQSKIAAAEWLFARGNLDPSINSSWSEKDFDKKRYYRQYQGKFNIPTQLGIDFVGGYENTEGVFLNPENYTDPYGLWHLGIEVNLLQGLIVNERKIALQQAKVFQDMTENERQLLLNQLLYKASKAYLEWQQYYFFQGVLNENIQIANAYFENTKLSFQNGEKTAMDTLEAFIMYQDANNLLQKNNGALTKSRQKVENYLWYEKTPISLQNTTKPEDYNNTIYPPRKNTSIPNIVNTHPLIQSYINKQSYYSIKQRLKREKLKPKLKVKYNPLLSTSNSLAPNLSLSDYKWGFDFSMPLLFRKEKADIQLGDIQIQEIGLDIQNKKNELQNKLENSLQQQAILREQITLSQQNLQGYRLLLEGENEKFRYGESSVFLLNKRQEKYINGRLKLIELNIKLQKELLNYLYYSNELIQ